MKRKLIPVEKAAPLHDRIREILVSAKISASRSVNSTQVVAYWLSGREIVEEQQHGKKRASYGDSLLIDLSKRLQREFGGSCSAGSLRYMRQFYLIYPRLLNKLEICHAARDESKNTSWLPGEFNLYIFMWI